MSLANIINSQSNAYLNNKSFDLINRASSSEFSGWGQDDAESK